MRASSIALLASAACGSSFLFPRGESFTVNTIHNPKHVAHGPSAKAKAMAKYAHLVDSSVRVGAIGHPNPCKLVLSASSSLYMPPSHRTYLETAES